jgi:hypothetical protein
MNGIEWSTPYPNPIANTRWDCYLDNGSVKQLQDADTSSIGLVPAHMSPLIVMIGNILTCLFVFPQLDDISVTPLTRPFIRYSRMPKAAQQLEEFLESMSRELEDWHAKLPSTVNVELRALGALDKRSHSTLPAVLMLQYVYLRIALPIDMLLLTISQDDSQICFDTTASAFHLRFAVW